MRIFLFIVSHLIALHCLAQSYTSYFTGDIADVTVPTTQGTCIMGGATEHDEAMRWFLQKAEGGDILVIRASGSNGYNNYLYTELGVNVNSVETIVFHSSSAASDPYVLNQISRAEAIWMAGGDQWNYVDYWRNTEVGTLLNHHMLVKNAPIGGTSAGMAVLGQSYFSAQNGSITSATALANPFGSNVTLGNADFLETPFLNRCITDTHYDDPDRRGRHMTFLARLSQDNNELFYGIACDEYTAVCIDEFGMARAYGYAPEFDDNVYFLQVDCQGEFLPENCIANTPLTWNRNQEAVKVYHIAADEFGTHSLDLNDWVSGSGGEWQHWWIENGILMTADGEVPSCPNSLSEIERLDVQVFPNPGTEFLMIQGLNKGDQFSITDNQGRVLTALTYDGNGIGISELSPGTYFIKLKTKLVSTTIKWIKE